MGKRKWKNQGVTPVSLQLNLGINYSKAGETIGDNECQLADNMLYDTETDCLMTRPGTVLVNTTPLPSSITKLYHYIKDASNSWLIATAGNTIYYLSGSSFVTIGTLTNATPSLLTFNGKLLVADGSTNLKYWDGSTFAAVSTGAPKATCLSMIKNRVVANHSDEPDSVYMSGAASETAWNTSTEGAIGLRAGYGDGLIVNGFAVFGDDLLVSKVGRTTTGARCLMRVNVAAAYTTDWYVKPFSKVNAFATNRTVSNAFNNVFFADTNGFRSIKGVQEYGDLATDPIGRKVDILFRDNSCSDVKFIPTYNSVWFLVAGKIYCYYDFNKGFTSLNFQWGSPTALCEMNNVVYLGSSNGYLYYLSEDESTDEVTDGVFEQYTSEIKTKAFSSTGDLILKRVKFRVKPVAEAIINLNGCIGEETPLVLSSHSIGSSGTYIYDATGYIDDATDYIGEDTQIQQLSSFAKMRGSSIALMIQALYGRFQLQDLQVEFAPVG